MEDDHVDRPGVQARRRVEPTGTNRPTGLIAPVIRVRTGSAAAEAGEADNTVAKQTSSRRCRCAIGYRSACLPNRTLDVAQPCAAKSQTNCDAPVWWPERRAQNPIPSRTRPLNTPAPMVLCLKTRESRSPPDLPIASSIPSHRSPIRPRIRRPRSRQQAPRTSRTHLRVIRIHLARGGAAR